MGIKPFSYSLWLNDEIAAREARNDDASRQKVVILQHARDILDQPRG